MGLKFAHGVGRQESIGDPRIECCAIQDGYRRHDLGLGCTVCIRTKNNVISISMIE